MFLSNSPQLVSTFPTWKEPIAFDQWSTRASLTSCSSSPPHSLPSPLHEVEGGQGGGKSSTTPQAGPDLRSLGSTSLAPRGSDLTVSARPRREGERK